MSHRRQAGYELASASGGYPQPSANPWRLPVPAVDDSWRVDAACTGMPTAWWFPPRSVRPVQALEVCDGCPVREQCLDAAIAEEGTTAPHGVRGGLTAQRRMRLGRQRRRARAPRSG